ncbi:MAG TPA: alpha/beta fold hydrolase [Thermoanaerobaculia bacterium]|nr:alpha/beta fold hydrolase [Thermoanaerobaculia bacterium]
MRRSRSLFAALILAIAGTATDARASVTGTPVALKAADGTKLAATYYAGDKPGPGILLLHQCNRDRSSWNGLAESLAQEGFHVLTMDYRGFGESGGKRFTELTPDEATKTMNDAFPADVDVAYDYLRAQPGVQGVMGAGGASCGVNQSIQLSRRHPEVKSLVLLSGNTDRAGRQSLHGKSSPVLMIAAADDDDGIVNVMSWIEASSGNPVNRFVEYKTGGHGTVMFQPHPELPGEIVAWYDATLIGKGKPASTDNTARRNSASVRLLMTTDEPGGFSRAAEMLEAERRKDPKSSMLEPAAVNLLGYQAIQAGDPKGAVAIMMVNVNGHPTSANAWDSLGDAYLADGQRDEARQAAEKSLQLLDADTSLTDATRKEIRNSAQQKLDQLKGASTSK